MRTLAVVAMFVCSAVAIAADVEEPKVSEEDRKAALAVAERAEANARGASVNQAAIGAVARSRVVAAEMQDETAAMQAEVERRVEASKALAREVDASVGKINPDRPPSFREILGEGELASAAEIELDAAMREAAELDALEPPKPKYRLFVSRSLGEAGMQQALAYGEKHQDMVIVMRGTKPGEDVVELVEYLARLQPPEEGKVRANVQLDPPSFRDGGISVVPTLQRLDDEGKVIASVRGIANPEYLERQIAAGATGDLGVRGTTAEILEQDLIDVMKASMEAYDWEGAAVAAQNRFWSQQELQDLPKAQRDRRRLHDPSMAYPEDVVTPAGTVLVRAGQVFNPLEDMPLDDTIIVFDGTDPKQVAWVEEALKTVKTSNYWLITTRVDTEVDHGWGSFSGLMERLNERIYYLLPGQKEVLGLERVPSVITQAGNRLQIDEFVVRN